MRVLLIIDMLNGFCRPGYPLSLPDSTAGIEKYIADRIKKTFSEGGKVIFLCDNHTLSDPEIGHPYPPHCMKGTKEAEIIDELRAGKLSKIAERSGRAQDKDDGGTLETLRREGYM